MSGPRTNAHDIPLHMVAAFPPPVNGMTLVTDRMADRLAKHGPTRIHKVTGAEKSTGTLWWRIEKHVRFLGALISGAASERGGANCYFVLDSRMGLWLNVVEALALRAGFREVWLHHHVFSYISSHDRRMALILKILGTKARHIVLGTRMAEGLQHHYKADTFHVLNNAGFVDDVPPAKPRERLETIGFLSNITREKGIGLFMETIRRVQTDDTAPACLIAGPIDDPELRDEVERFCAEAPERRTWLGPVRGVEKLDFFGRTDLLLFPSLYANEALPVTIYEALAANVPVLATERGCVAEQLSGSNWFFEDEAFVENAEACIREWLATPAIFAKASQDAADLHRQQLAAHAGQMQALMAGMFGQGTRSIVHG